MSHLPRILERIEKERAIREKATPKWSKAFESGFSGYNDAWAFARGPDLLQGKNQMDYCTDDGSAARKQIQLDADFIEYAANNWLRIIEDYEKMARALEFYADENKYFMRKRKVNLQETTAVFHVDDPSKLPTDFESEVFECTARLKVDQGKTARNCLAEVGREYPPLSRSTNPIHAKSNDATQGPHNV